MLQGRSIVLSSVEFPLNNILGSKALFVFKAFLEIKLASHSAIKMGRDFAHYVCLDGLLTFVLDDWSLPCVNVLP
jgi:hypothetical protein